MIFFYTHFINVIKNNNDKWDPMSVSTFEIPLTTGWQCVSSVSLFFCFYNLWGWKNWTKVIVFKINFPSHYTSSEWMGHTKVHKARTAVLSTVNETLNNIVLSAGCIAWKSWEQYIFGIFYLFFHAETSLWISLQMENWVIFRWYLLHYIYYTGFQSESVHMLKTEIICKLW